MQVICIGIINFSTSLSYAVIQAIPPNRYANLGANIGYAMTQGVTGVIYLCFNRSIRKIIWKKLGCHNSSTGIVFVRQRVSFEFVRSFFFGETVSNRTVKVSFLIKRLRCNFDIKLFMITEKNSNVPNIFYLQQLVNIKRSLQNFHQTTTY